MRITHLNALHHFEAERLSCGPVLSATLQPWVLKSLQHFQLSIHIKTDCKDACMERKHKTPVPSRQAVVMEV